MASFSLPPIHDNPDGGWGPSPSNIPEQFKFKDIPYAPFSKSDKLGRFADWNDTTSEGRQTAVGLPNTRDTRGVMGRSKREGAQAFGSGTANAFAYFHVEDESSFSLVDNKAAPPRRGGFNRGRGAGRGGATFFAARGAQRGARGGAANARGAAQRGGRRGWRDWEKVRSSVRFVVSDIDGIFCRTIVLGNLLSLSHLNGRCWRRSSSTAWPSSN